MRLRIDRITVAVNDMDAMVRFYNAVFDTHLVLVDPSSEFPFHVGQLADLELVFCPNTLTQIEASKNRQQLRMVVDDLEATVRTGLSAGGMLLGEVQTTDAAIVGGLSDPDGNSIELIQYRR